MHAKNEPTRSDQIRGLAWLIASIRPDWNERGISSKLTSSSAPISDLAVAALLAARDRTDQRTPAIITLDGAHWRASGKELDPVETTLPTQDRPRCHTCCRFVTQDQHDQLMDLWYAPEDRHDYQPADVDELTRAEYAAIGRRGASAAREALRDGGSL